MSDVVYCYGLYHPEARLPYAKIADVIRTVQYHFLRADRRTVFYLFSVTTVYF